MKGRTYKIVSYWLTSLKQPCKKSTKEPDMAENAPLLDSNPRKGCTLRVDGPDGIWSWIIAFANFLVNFIIVGLGRMSGLLYVEFMHYFSIDRMTASIPFSIQQAGRNLFGPLAGILGQKYGLRFITILGGLVGSFSAATAYFKLDITTISIFWGLFFGMSTALTTTLNQISIDQHFVKNRATAGGFAFSGGCFGAFFFPVVIETLLEKYEMRGTFLIIAAIILFVVPAAVMLTEPPWLQSEVIPSTSKYGSFRDGESSLSVDSIEEIKAKNKRAESGKIKPFMNIVDFKVLQENSDMVFKFLTIEIHDRNDSAKAGPTDYHKLDKRRLLNEMDFIYASVAAQNLSGSSSDSQPFDSKPDSNPAVRFTTSTTDSNDSDTGILRIMDDVPRKVYIQNRLKELSEARGIHLVTSFPYWEQSQAWSILIELRKVYDVLNDKEFVKKYYSKNTLDVQPPKPKNVPKSHKRETERSNTFCYHMKTAVQLHGNPIFLLICLCRGVFMLTFVPVVTIIVDFAMDQGLPKSDGKYIISTLSLGDLIGRLCLGWVTDRQCLSLPRYMLLGMLVLGGSTASLPMMESRASLFAGVLLFGILQGSLFVRHPLLVSQYLDKHEQAIGMGFINFLSGFLGFALPAFIGYFRDKLGSYNDMFYINGIICGAVGLIWILEPLFLEVCSANEKKKKKKVTS